MADERPTFLDWLWPLQHKPNFRKARPLGAVFGVLLLLLAVCLFTIGTGLSIKLAALALDLQADASGEAIRNIGLVLAAVLGAPFIIWRSVVAQKQADIAARGLLADRITKAVDQLGSDNVSVRIGGIYALESIMLDSRENSVRMWTILNAYLKHEQQLIDRDSEVSADTTVRGDIQAALDVITARRVS